MSNVCANIEPILDCSKKHTNTKSTLEEKIKLEKLKYKQIRERHRLREQLKEERSALIPKLPRSFERLLHLLIKQAILKRPPKISTFFSQLLEKLVDCRIKQELGLSSSRADPFKDYEHSLGEDAEKDDLAAEYIARRLAAGSDEEEEEFRLTSGIRPFQPPSYSTSKVASLHVSGIQSKTQPLVRTASRQRSTTSSLKPFAVKPVSPPAARSGVSSKASSAMKSGSASKHIYKQAPTQTAPSRSMGKSHSSKASPASKSASAIRTKVHSQSSQTSKLLPQSQSRSTSTNKTEAGANVKLDEAEKLQQQQEVKEIEEINRETSTKTSNILSVS